MYINCFLQPSFIHPTGGAAAVAGDSGMQLPHPGAAAVVVGKLCNFVIAGGDSGEEI